MNSSYYGSSFLIALTIYLFLGLIYLSFTDEFTPIKEKRPQIVKISLIEPIVPKKEIKKEKPKEEKPKPTAKPTPKPKPKKKKRKKKKVVKKKRVVKKSIIKKSVKKRSVKKVVKPPKPKPTPPPQPIIEEPIIEEEIIYYTPAPVVEEIVPQPIIEAPIYHEPAPIYSEVVPQETLYTEAPQPITPTPTIQAPAPIIQAPPPRSQQRYIINEPLPVNVPLSPPAHSKAVNSDDLSNEKRAFKQETREIINSNKRYPTMAKRRHIQGRVHVIFDILMDGRITNIRTSGASTILQKSARKSVMRSSPLTIPSKLESQFPMNNVSINIDYQLQ